MDTAAQLELLVSLATVEIRAHLVRAATAEFPDSLATQVPSVPLDSLDIRALLVRVASLVIAA